MLISGRKRREYLVSSITACNQSSGGFETITQMGFHHSLEPWRIQRRDPHGMHILLLSMFLVLFLFPLLVLLMLLFLFLLFLPSMLLLLTFIEYIG